MCWGVPARVVRVEGVEALVDFGGGARRRVLVGLEEVGEGDLVVVHAGVIIGKIRREEALEILKVYAELYAELSPGSPSRGEEAVERVLEELKRSLGLGG